MWESRSSPLLLGNSGRKFRVSFFPTVLILDPAGYKGAEGTIVGQVVGAELNVGKFVDMLKEVVAQYRK